MLDKRIRSVSKHSNPLFPPYLLCVVLAFACGGSPSLSLATSKTGHSPGRPVDSGGFANKQPPPAPARSFWGTRWCFGAGAPMTNPPALGAEGQVYLATDEGYVHGLSAGGGFEWSYTMKGAAVAGPVVLPDATVVVATSVRLLYALRPNGTRLWVLRVPEPIATPMAVSAKGTLVFGAAEHVVYAVSRHGGIVWRIPLKSKITTGPRVHEDGTVFIGTESGVVSWISPARRTLWPSPSVDRLAAGPEGEPFQLWLASGQVFSSNGAMSPKADLRFLRRLPGGGLLGTRGKQLIWLGQGGSEESTSELDADPSADPAPGLEPEEAYIPTSDGTILRARRGGQAVEYARLGYSPVSELLVDRPRQRLLAAAGEGRVCAVSLSHERASD